ncbi:hypothetical protein CRG98_024836 [Punica granatum]|nr:hypothetical protein CRG98_024836 [Punica granatum]
MATATPIPGNGSRRRGLNPQAASFFPQSITNPNPNPLHHYFSPLPPQFIPTPAAMPPPVPPHAANYFPHNPPYPRESPPHRIPRPPPTGHPVQQETLPAAAASFGRGSSYRPRGRGLRAARGWSSSRCGKGRGAWSWIPPRRWAFWTRRDDDSFDNGSSGIGEVEGTSASNTSPTPRQSKSYDRVVIARPRHEPINRRKKPVVTLSPGGAESTVMMRNIPNKYT